MLKVIRMITNGNRARLYRSMSLAIMEALFGAVPFAVLYFMLCDIIDGKFGYRECFLYSGIIVASAAIRVFFSYIAMTTSRKEGTTMIMQLRLRLGEHIRKLSLGFFQTHDTGELSHKTLTSVNQLEMIVAHLLPEIAATTVLTVLVVCVLFFVDTRMAIAALVTIPLASVAFVMSQKIMTRYGNRLYASALRLADCLLEFVHGIKFIKSFNTSQHKFHGLVERMEDFKEKSIGLEANLSPVMVVTGIMIDCGIVLLMVVGTFYLLGGSMQPKTMIIFLIISAKFFENLKMLSVNALKLSYFVVAGKKIQSLFDEKILSGTGQVAQAADDTIEFKQVGFSYNTIPVLKNINLTIPPKTLTAFVGPSGSGKTTMTNLIARFFDPDEGTISIGGADMRTIDPEKVLEKVSMVFQKVTLFRDTIYNNIKIGKHGATEEEVIEAARKANCHEFIERLPEGYQTMVGEQGANLSGGEQQRISIARAMLKDAPIILLDEATASLDPENEIFIQNAIAALLENKTIIVIAHRLKTIKNADRIVVFKDGEIQEQGTHDALLSGKGLYYNLWTTQQHALGWSVVN